MTASRLEQRLKASESLKDRPWLRRQIISQEAIKKTFENDPCQKITRLQHKKKILSSLCSRWSKRRERKVRGVSGNLCWVQQWFRSIWRKTPVSWMTWRITGLRFNGERNPHFFHRWSCLQQIEWSSRNTVECENQTTSLNHDASLSFCLWKTGSTVKEMRIRFPWFSRNTAECEKPNNQPQSWCLAS